MSNLTTGNFGVPSGETVEEARAIADAGVPRQTDETYFDRDFLMDQDLTLIWTGEWRWGWIKKYVFEQDGVFWAFSVRVHVEDGWQGDEPIRCTRVQRVKKEIEAWEPVET